MLKFIELTVLGLWALFCLPTGGLCIGYADFLDKQLASNKFHIANHFDDSVGHDNFTDNFYAQFKTEAGRNIDLANEYYQRHRFTQVRVTSAAAANPATEASSSTAAAQYNFAVAERSFDNDPSGAIFNNRWDIKVNNFGHQFMGLYYGTDSFITNRMRSYLVRWVGNGIKDYLPVLDETEASLRDDFEIISAELKSVIRFIIMRFHTKIKNLLYDLDYFDAREKQEKQDASAGGSLVIVSGAYVIVVNMGEGRVYGCDNTGELHDMTAEHENRKLNLFINDGHPVAEPFIHLQPRNFKGADGSDRTLRFVLLQSPTTAQFVGQDELAELIRAEMGTGKLEQEQYLAIVTQAMQRLADKFGAQKDGSSALDHSLIVVGLKERNGSLKIKP